MSCVSVALICICLDFDTFLHALLSSHLFFVTSLNLLFLHPDLGLCIKHFVVPLRTKMAEGKFFDLTSWQPLNYAFKYLETVYALNSELLEQLRKCMDRYECGAFVRDVRG